MQKHFVCGIVAIVGIGLFIRPAAANKNFIPDWMFKGSSLSSFRTLGEADWRAENGEIVGTPRSAAGGWLILDHPLEDVQFASTFRCTGGCRSGLMLRSQSTPEGIRGVYVALPDGENPAGAFALSLDSQGHELKREPLKPGGGMVRLMIPPPANAQGAAGTGRPPGRPERSASRSPVYRPQLRIR